MPSATPSYPAHWTAERALRAYLEENGWSRASYDEPVTKAVVFGIPFFFPNTRRHRAALMMHDLHHCATGYGTDLAGEGEMAAWELRRGLRPLGPYVGSVVLLGALAGLLVAPRRTLRAWFQAGPGRSLFHLDIERDYEALLRMRLGDLRASLGIPPEGLADRRGLHEAAPRRA